MEQTGKIYQINEIEVISEKFKKREFVLEISNNPAYVEKVIFTLVQDKVSLIDGYKKGDEIEVSINLKGREWTSPKDNTVKFFNTLDVWKINASNSAPSSDNAEDISQRVQTDVNPQGDEDDLPF